MLSREEIKDYRMRSGLSYRDVASYCDVSYQLIEMVENGKKGLSEHAYREIIKGINGAKQAKKNGTFKQADKITKIESSDADKKTKNVAKHKKSGDGTNAKI